MAVNDVVINLSQILDRSIPHFWDRFRHDGPRIMDRSVHLGLQDGPLQEASRIPAYLPSTGGLKREPTTQAQCRLPTPEGDDDEDDDSSPRSRPRVLGSSSGVCLPFGFPVRLDCTSALLFPTEPLSASRADRKRRRDGHDVDGPNTAALSSKKRRLRGDLITSRLSQPYSQPATHILNREGQKSGDKRFLKMAKSLDMARQSAHLHATSFLRFALVNRLRKRHGLRPPGPMSAQTMEPQVEPQAEADATAPWHRLQPGSRGGSDAQTQAEPRHPCRRDDLGCGRAIQSIANAPGPCIATPAAVQLPSSEAAATKRPTSPRIQPTRSPEPQPLNVYDDLEEDSFAFMHPDDASSGHMSDDPEHVYSDFDLIFGGPQLGVRSLDDHTYEEYVDELDGISWVCR